MKHTKLQIFLMAGAAFIFLAPSTFAQEPHSSEVHTYKQSIYNTGPVLTLQDAIKKAVEASPRLRSAKAELNAARGAEDQAGYWSNPEFAFEAENIAGSGQYGRTNSAEYTYGLSQKVELGGKRSARKNIARAEREAAYTNLLAERLNLARDIRIAYSSVLAEAEALKLAIDQEKQAKGILATVSARVDAAAEPEIQRSKAEVAYATSVISREQEERQLKVAKVKLAGLWGGSNLDASLEHAYFFELRAPRALNVYSEKLDRLPDIQRLNYVKASRKSFLQFEQAQAIPDPRFSLGVRDFRESGEQALVFGVSFPIPILHQNGGNIAKAQAEVIRAESDSRQAVLMLEQQLVENWHNWNSAYLEAEKLKTQLLPIAERAFRLARAGYEKGKFPYLEVLDAQRTLFDARAQYHNSLKRYHTSLAHVERLTTTVGGES